MKLTPQGNPPARLLRPQPPEFFTQPYVLAMLDTHNNIVHYRKDIAETLDNDARKKIFFLREKYLVMPTVAGFI